MHACTLQGHRGRGALGCSRQRPAGELARGRACSDQLALIRVVADGGKALPHEAGTPHVSAQVPHDAQAVRAWRDSTACFIWNLAGFFVHRAVAACAFSVLGFTALD
jgi:hypothetical protein